MSDTAELRVRVGLVHAQVIGMAPWAPAAQTLAGVDGPSDLVLIAVPEGMGRAALELVVDRLAIKENQP